MSEKTVPEPHSGALPDCATPRPNPILPQGPRPLKGRAAATQLRTPPTCLVLSPPDTASPYFDDAAPRGGRLLLPGCDDDVGGRRVARPRSQR